MFLFSIFNDNDCALQNITNVFSIWCSYIEKCFNSSNKMIQLLNQPVLPVSCRIIHNHVGCFCFMKKGHWILDTLQCVCVRVCVLCICREWARGVKVKPPCPKQHLMVKAGVGTTAAVIDMEESRHPQQNKYSCSYIIYPVPTEAINHYRPE